MSVTGKVEIIVESTYTHHTLSTRSLPSKDLQVSLKNVAYELPFIFVKKNRYVQVDCVFMSSPFGSTGILFYMSLSGNKTACSNW